MKGEQRFQLSEPVTFGSETYTELVFARPRVKHFKVLDKVEGEMGKAIQAISSLTGLPSPVIEELCIEDFVAASEVVEGFFKQLGVSG